MGNNLHQITSAPPQPSSGNGGHGGGGINKHIACINERIARIEEQIKHLATREDIANAKTSLLIWLIGTAISSLAAISAVFWVLLNQ